MFLSHPAMVRSYQKRTLKTWKGYELVLIELMVLILVSKLVFSVYTIRWNVRCVRQYTFTDKLHSELRILDYLFYYVCKDQQKNWLLLYNCELTNFLDQFRSLYFHILNVQGRSVEFRAQTNMSE